MNSNCAEGNGGVNIKPSARRSIHDHKTMLIKDSDRDSNVQGMDEVDFSLGFNNTSDMLRETSPQSIKIKKKRSNSCSTDDITINDDNTDMLSKSLPATLQSPLSSSDHYNLEELNQAKYSPVSINKNKYFRTFNGNTEPFSHPEEPRDVGETPADLSRHESREDQSQSRFSCSYIHTLFIFAIVIAFISFKCLYTLSSTTQDKSTQTVNHDKIIFESNMNNLQEKYNIDNISMLKLKTGISTIFSRMDTGSFMFVYNSKTNNFNAVLFEKFIDEVAYTAARYLRNHISTRHTVLVSSTLDMREHGELINKYRDDFDRSGVLLVKEIDGVPSELAMAFHYYCDEYDPLVKRSAIFFTLNVANCSNTAGQKSTHDFIEKCLTRKWDTVPPENIRPLLTRVVDIIIDVTSVF